jgi:hypothetical protein
MNESRTCLGIVVMGMLMLSTLSAHADPVDWIDNRAQPNPNLGGIDGANSMHGDSVSSDTFPFKGPGLQPWLSQKGTYGALCTTTLIRSDGRPLAVCSSAAGPKVVLGNKQTGASEAELPLVPGGGFTAAYAYMDLEDRLVVIDGSQNLLSIAAKRVGETWELSVEKSLSLAAQLVPPPSCPGGVPCDSFVGVVPSVGTRVWYVTRMGRIGNVDSETGLIQSLQLPVGENVANTVSSTNDGRLAVVSTRATYLLVADASGAPSIAWRQPYQNALVRKPGQLNAGSGSSPTFFGPGDGTEYLVIVDNAPVQENVVVYDASVGSGGQVICEHPILTPGGSAVENSPIGIENTVIVASSFGYSYPGLPGGPMFIGGIDRVDVNGDGSGCSTVWQNDVKSAAVPKLSVGDQLVYTVGRRNPNGTNAFSTNDTYHFLAIDVTNGKVMQELQIGQGPAFEPLQIAGNPGHGRVYWQGVLTGLVRISPLEE